MVTTGIGYTVAWMFWILSSSLFLLLLVNFPMVQALVLIAILFYIGSHYMFGGVEFLAIKWFNQYKIGLKAAKF